MLKGPFWPSLLRSLKDSFSREKALPKYRELVRNDIVHANIVRTLISAIALFLMELSNVIGDYFYPVLDTVTQCIVNIASITGMVFAAGMFVLLIVFINRPRENPRRNEILIMTFWWVCWFFSSIFLMVNISGDGDTRNLFFLPILYAVLPLFSSRQILPMLMYYVVSISGMTIIFDKNYHFIQISIVMSILCYLVTQLIFSSQVRSYSFYHETQDKTEQLDAMVKQLEELSKTDQLTRLPNRRALDTYLQMVWDHCLHHHVPMMVMIIDIDFFKSYNDMFGHIKGDDYLVAIAQALRKATVGVTDYIGRFGGEEFMVVSDHMDIDDTKVFAEKLRLNILDLKLPAACKEVSDYITVSIGAYIEIPDDNCTILELVQTADNLLYEAKNRGRNRSIVQGKP